MGNKKQFKLSYEKYKKMSFLLIEHIRKKEAENEMSAAGDDGDSAPTKSEVINWYLEEVSGDIETEEELLEHKQVVEKLIYQDQVIVPLTNNTDEAKKDDPFLVVHP